MISSSRAGTSGLRRTAVVGPVQDSFEDDGCGVAAERCGAGGHLIQHSTKGEQVGARIEFLALGLLRGHVGDSADGGAGTGEDHPSISVGELRSTVGPTSRVEGISFARPKSRTLAWPRW